MKNQILLAVLAVFVSTVVADPIGVVFNPETVFESEPIIKTAEEVECALEVEPATIERSEVNSGIISPEDRLLFRQYYLIPGVANSFHSQEFTYRGNSYTTITAVRAIEIGPTQYARAHIVDGGVDSNTVTIGLSSAISYGWHFLVEIYGR